MSINSEIDIVTRRDSVVTVTPTSNDPLEATRIQLLKEAKQIVIAWQQEREALQRAQEIKDNAYTNSIGYAITEAAALAAGKRDLVVGW